MRKLFSILSGIIFILILVSLLALYNYSNNLKFSTEKLVHYHPKLTTQIFDKNGDLIANIYDKKNRLYAPYKEIPPRLIEAVVAIEDTAFFEHSGVNPEAILRAVIKAIKYRKVKEGASTLTQQLIKNTILTPKKTLTRKINEALLAIKLETQLNKEQILERYLNEIFYGHNYYGVKTAAQGYFHKDLKDLDLKEIAILAGLPKAPTTYDPTRHLSNALSRANTVLDRMKNLGWITKDEYKKYVKEIPTIYGTSFIKNKYPFIVDEVVRELKKDFPDIKNGGYKIYTTFDPTLQKLAEESLKFGYKGILARYLSNLKRRAVSKNKRVNYEDLNGAMVVLDNKTGNILALVGSINYAKSQFNRAVQSRRQPGSAIKPFIYQTALDLGYSPQSRLIDMSRSFKYGKKVWNPKNYEKNFEGFISLRDALVHSRNLATINLVREIGLSQVYNSLTKMQFEGLKKDLSLSLGTFGISVLDFAGKYTLFSNYGTMLKPKIVTKIVTKDGDEKEIATTKYMITQPKQAYLMISILKDVVKRGTARKAKVEGIETAGKTGTTNEYKDAWFCGFIPDIEILTWYGKDNNKPMYKETGGKAAGPAFAHFVKGYIALHPETKRKFDIPDGVRVVKIHGKDEYFTDISQPPNDSVGVESSTDIEKLLF